MELEVAVFPNERSHLFYGHSYMTKFVKGSKVYKKRINLLSKHMLSNNEDDLAREMCGQV